MKMMKHSNEYYNIRRYNVEKGDTYIEVFDHDSPGYQQHNDDKICLANIQKPRKKDEREMGKMIFRQKDTESNEMRETTK